jgi:hypothetical protein
MKISRIETRKEKREEKGRYNSPPNGLRLFFFFSSSLQDRFRSAVTSGFVSPSRWNELMKISRIETRKEKREEKGRYEASN